MANGIADFDSRGFVRALTDALWRHVEGRTQTEVADLLGVSPTRLNSYFREGKEPKASILFLACTKLPGFYFDYGGFRFRGTKLGTRARQRSDAQLTFNFYRQIRAGNVRLKLKRPADRVELSVSLAAATRRRVVNGVSASGHA